MKMLVFAGATVLLGLILGPVPQRNGVVPAEPERAAYRAEVRALFQQLQFTELEHRARALRLSKDRFSSGMPKLRDLYIGVLPEGKNAAELGAFGRLYEAWRKQYPKSSIPRMGLAELEYSRAFQARGEKAAAEVTEEGWLGFTKHMRSALTLMYDAIADGETDPQTFITMIRFCKVTSCPRAEAETFMKAGLTIDPAYETLYVAMADYLDPKWNGSTAEFAAFAARAADESRARLGDIAYMRIAEMALRWGGGLPKQHPELSWPRIQRGLDDVEQRFPNSARTYHLRARFACAYRDADKTMKALQAVGHDWSSDAEVVWSKQENFDWCWLWARRMTAQ